MYTLVSVAIKSNLLFYFPNIIYLIVFQLLLSVMLSLLLVGSSVFAAIYTGPTAPTEQPTAPTLLGEISDDGPPSVSVTPKPAPVSTSGPLYGTTSA